jgi:hypothetical protein
MVRAAKGSVDTGWARQIGSPVRTTTRMQVRAGEEMRSGLDDGEMKTKEFQYFPNLISQGGLKIGCDP